MCDNHSSFVYFLDIKKAVQQILDEMISMYKDFIFFDKYILPSLLLYVNSTAYEQRILMT